VVAGARRFAANRGQNLARTEHLLFMLDLDPGSSARRVLNYLGVDPARVKKELNDLIPPPPRPGRRSRRVGKGDQGIGACSFCGHTDPHRAMVTGPASASATNASPLGRYPQSRRSGRRARPSARSRSPFRLNHGV
jgi:hypothetical protein